MKHLMKLQLLLLMLFVSAAMIMVSSCKDDEIVEGDKTDLNALIVEADALAASATSADYPQAAIDTYNSTLQTIKEEAAKKLTQEEIDNLEVQLTEAMDTFEATAYDAIPQSALLIGLSFDEGSGTSLVAEGKNLTAVLTAGPSQIFGTATNIPSFIDGIAGKAMYFSNGSHLEISGYSASDFLGNTLSIAVWLKPDSTRPGNYIASFNYWNSWKFQIQEQNKPFFTVHTLAGYVDADNESDYSVPNDAWTHVVASMNLTAETLDLYVNGVNTKHWTVTEKPNLTGTVSPYATVLPIMIGACTTYAEAKAAWTWEWPETPQAWDGFIGAMDEFKIYNIALTDGQVSKLYNDEKP
ncbi:MAG: hypothetical protein KBB71_03590 [Lentimicrobiaceae bacterium]|nr:hypothetical protein [Lentimicrobiaceae bacterium]